MKMMHIHTTILAYFLTDTLNKEKYLLNNLYEKLKNFEDFKKSREKMSVCVNFQCPESCVCQ